MVAVILSAQCTDKRVNMITPALMKTYPDAESMAKATPEEIFEYIKSCTYPNNKAKHLSGMAKMLVERIWRNSTVRSTSIAAFARCRKKNRKCCCFSCLQETGDGSRYPCFQGIKQDRSG